MPQKDLVIHALLNSICRFPTHVNSTTNLEDSNILKYYLSDDNMSKKFDNLK